MKTLETITAVVTIFFALCGGGTKDRGIGWRCIAISFMFLAALMYVFTLDITGGAG